MSNPRFYPVPTHISKPKQTDARFTQFLETIQPAKTKRGERKLNKNGEFVSTTHETAVEEPSSSEEESSDEESEMEEEEIEEIEDILHTKDVTFKEEKSNRLAIVNLDWAHIKASDIYHLLASITKGVQSVKIYPSEFGKPRIASENINGPPIEALGPIIKERMVAGSSRREAADDSEGPDSGEGSDSDSVSDEEGSQISGSEVLEDEDDISELDEGQEPENDNGADYNSANLRKYELERLRYYYAIAVFDSVESADTAYREGDGTEVEKTSNLLDLRFVPDGEVFEESEVTDSASGMHVSYKPLAFETKALRQSQVTLTWDEDLPERNKLRTVFGKSDLDNIDLDNYVATDSDTEDEDREAAKEKYRALLLNNGASSDEDDQDMEITFSTGLKQTMADKSDSEESTASEDEVSTQKQAKAKSKKTKEKDIKEKKKDKKKQLKKRKAAELEDSAEEENVDEDEAERSHFDLQQISKEYKKQKRREEKLSRKSKAKAATGKEVTAESSGFEIDTADPRFAALVEDHTFAVDPNHPSFKATAAMDAFVRTRAANPVDTVKEHDFTEADELSRLANKLKKQKPPKKAKK